MDHTSVSRVVALFLLPLNSNRNSCLLLPKTVLLQNDPSYRVNHNVNSNPTAEEELQKIPTGNSPSKRPKDTKIPTRTIIPDATPRGRSSTIAVIKLPSQVPQPAWAPLGCTTEWQKNLNWYFSLNPSYKGSEIASFTKKIRAMFCKQAFRSRVNKRKISHKEEKNNNGLLKAVFKIKFLQSLKILFVESFQFTYLLRKMHFWMKPKKFVVCFFLVAFKND